MVILIYKANLTFFVKSSSEEFLLIKQFDMNVHSKPLNTKRGSEDSSNIGLIYDRVLSHKHHLGLQGGGDQGKQFSTLSSIQSTRLSIFCITCHHINKSFTYIHVLIYINCKNEVH